MPRILALLAFLAGCSSTTRILVVVDTDFDVPTELQSLSISARRTDAAPMTPTTRMLTGRMERDPSGDTTTQVPLSFAVVDRGSPSTGVEILVQGLDSDGAVLVERRAVVERFIEGRTLVLPMFLARSCSTGAGPRCATEETCVDGRCVSPNVDPETLEPLQEPGEELRDAGPTRDAGGSEDAGADCDDGRIVSIGSGPTSRHACASTECGTLVCWGLNDDGQLGDGTFNTRSSPRPVMWPAGQLVPDLVACGAHSTCASAGGMVTHCWGGNTNGQIGTDPSGMPFPEPRLVTGSLGSVSVGTGHACAISAVDGTTHCWGWNDRGQVGAPLPTMIYPRPTEVLTLRGASELDCASNHSCARTSGGGVYCWGDNTWGQIGITEPGPFFSTPQHAGVDDAVGLAVGRSHTCVIRNATERRVWCWGYNEHGEVGDGATSFQTALFMTSVMNATAITAGREHTCALTAGRTVMCWGNNAARQLGTAALGGTPTLPAEVPGLSDIVQIAAGEIHTCALRDDGVVLCWGADDAGQLGDGGLLPEPSRAQPMPIAWP